MQPFYSQRLFFHPPEPPDRGPLVEAVRSLRDPWLGWDEAYLEREVFACAPSSGRHAWVLKQMSDVVGALVAQRTDAGLAVNVLVAPPRQGVHFGAEAIGRIAERAFGYDDGDRVLSAPAIHLTFCAVNHRAMRVAQRLGCELGSEREASTLPLGGRTDLVRARLTPGTWAKLERGPAWDDARVLRLVESVLPGSAERIAKRLAQRASQKLAQTLAPARAPAPARPARSGDPVLDALLASPPRALATPTDLHEACCETPFGGSLTALQEKLAKAYFTDEQLGQICGELRRGVCAAGELHNAENAIAWIGRYMRLRPPRS